MGSIEERLSKLHETIPQGIELVAVSKFHPVSQIREAYEAGQRRFGESRVQELLEKIPQLPADIRWHFIGHLQTNKVRQLIGKTELIESVDSEKLLGVIDAESRKANIITRVLLQVHVAAEETKFGFLPEEMLSYFKEGKYNSLTHTHISGIMGMATYTADLNHVREDFRKISSLFREIKESVSSELRGFNEISMGMSGDWPLAIEEGATIIRIGTAIFGERNY